MRRRATSCTATARPDPSRPPSRAALVAAALVAGIEARWSAAVVAVAAPQRGALLHRDARDDHSGDRIEDRKAGTGSDQGSRGLGCAQQVLHAFARCRVRIQALGQTQLGPSQQLTSARSPTRSPRHRWRWRERRCRAAGARSTRRESTQTNSRNEPATHRCAVRSLVAECVRDPVKRQMIVTDARPSTNDEAAQMIRLNESASSPAVRPTTPSIVIHTSDAHDSRRAPAAALSHPASRSGVAGAGA